MTIDPQSSIRSKGNRLAAVLYVDELPRLGTYLPLADAIRTAGHLPLVLCSPELRTSSLAQPIRVHELRALKGVDLFFSSELLRDVAPANTTTIAIIHSIPDAALTPHGLNVNYRDFIKSFPTVIRSADYIAIGIRQPDVAWTTENDSIIKDVYPPSMLEQRRQFIDIVPAGYPKLDLWIQNLGQGGGFDHIVYSPTSVLSAVSRVRADGVRIVAALLKEFPHHRVVFRPYPRSSDDTARAELIRQFSSEPNFVYDASPLGIELQQRSATVVTDSSSSAITFALGSGRPLIMATLDERLRPSWKILLVIRCTPLLPSRMP